MSSTFVLFFRSRKIQKKKLTKNFYYLNIRRSSQYPWLTLNNNFPTFHKLAPLENFGAGSCAPPFLRRPSLKNALTSTTPKVAPGLHRKFTKNFQDFFFKISTPQDGRTRRIMTWIFEIFLTKFMPGIAEFTCIFVKPHVYKYFRK